MPMLLRATRSACVVAALVTVAAAGCGQDLDLGPLTGKDGFGLPAPGAPDSHGNSACAVNTVTAVPLPTTCIQNGDISWVQTDEGRFEYKFMSASCVVTGDGMVPSQGSMWRYQKLAACPMGVYWKFAPMPWRHNGPPLPADGTFPSAETFERAVVVLRGDQPKESLPDWMTPPFTHDGWEAVPRTVQVLPEQQAVFIRFDPRPSTGQRFVVAFSVPELAPDAVHLRVDPSVLYWALDILPGTAPSIE